MSGAADGGWAGTANRRHQSARLFALADQGFQGVASIVATALLGRSLPTGQFGAIGVMIGIYFFMAGFHRSAVVLPYITEHHVPGDAAADRRYHSDWWWLNIGAALLLSALLFALAALAHGLSLLRPDWGWIVEPLLLSAVVTPPLLAAEQARRWLYKIDRPAVVALASSAFFAAMIATASLVRLYRPDAVGGACAWLAAGIACTLTALIVIRPARPDWRASLDCFARHRRFASWLVLTILPYVFYSSATVVILIGILVGPLPAAVFTAARTLTNPAISIVSAIDSTDKPRATRALAEDGIRGLRRSIAGTRLLLVLVTGGYLAAVALFARPLIAFAFHGRYLGIEHEVQLLALAFFLFCLNQPSETLLIVMRASDVMFVVRSAAAVMTVAALIVAIPYGVSGMAIGLALAQAGNVFLLYLSEHWVIRRRHRGARG